MADMMIETMRSRVDRYLSRIDPKLVTAVVLGKEVFVDGTRHLYVFYSGEKFVSVGRPKLNAEELCWMLREACIDARKGVAVDEVRTRIFQGCYDQRT